MQTTIKEERQFNSCAFTGHREIEEKDKTTLFRKTLDCVRALVEQGVTAFYNGGAKGFDLLAGEAVLRVKKENTQKQIKLVLCVPCPNQDKAYEESQKTVYQAIVSEADEVINLSDHYYRGCMQNRDRYMADHADVLVSYLRKDTGGTAYTVQYFTKKYPQKELVLL